VGGGRVEQGKKGLLPLLLCHLPLRPFPFSLLPSLFSLGLFLLPLLLGLFLLGVDLELVSAGEIGKVIVLCSPSLGTVVIRLEIKLRREVGTGMCRIGAVIF
jgi:hypothetical protein